MRRQSTDAEKGLWRALRTKQLGGVKFRRQEPIGPYIADFVSFHPRLILEVDGGQHGEAAVRQADGQRTAWFEENGFTVLRFWNSEVLTNLEGVIDRVVETMARLAPPPPGPSP